MSVNITYTNIHYTKQTIGAQGLNLAVPGKQLIIDSDLSLAPGKIYGLVGPNGSGKSTLLKTLRDLRRDKEDSSRAGSIGIDTFYVEQEHDMSIEEASKNPVDKVLGTNYKLTKFQDELQKTEQLLEVIDVESEQFEAVQLRYAELAEFIDSFDLDRERVKVEQILRGLGFTTQDLVKRFDEFSGGWRTRVALARALYIEPELLLLDEPTNHLDLEATIWLSEYLQSWRKTAIVVSHNIGFIEDVCDFMLAIENCKLSTYRGAYHSYKKALKEAHKTAEKEWDQYQKNLKAAQKKGAKSIADLAKKPVPVRPPKPYDGHINFGEASGDIRSNIISFNDVSFGYSDVPILQKINMGFGMGDRIVLVGPNGSGKSTLIKLITGEITPTEGEVRVHPHAVIGYYNQHFEDQLPLDLTPVEYLRAKIPHSLKQSNVDQSVRSFLGRVRLDPASHLVPIGKLSGGQKARVAIVELIFMQPHCLILDEPTNHLDLDTVESLIDGLAEFNGCIFIITHDHNLITSIDAQVKMMDPATKNISSIINSYEAYTSYVMSTLH